MSADSGASTGGASGRAAGNPPRSERPSSQVRANGVVDYLCNGFTPDRQAVWDGAIGDSEIAVKIRRNPEDSFCEPDAMVDRMDELGIDTLLLPTGNVGPHGTLDTFDQEHVANRWEETEKLVGRWPGRFVALALINPLLGMRSVREVRAHLAEPWVVGCYLHTHSFDRRFDHADLFPFYTVCTDADVPVVMQAGTSGGLMPSECGQPISIDRAALYFADTRFVLSHLGWPWENEAIAMALKFPNVYLGTGAYPPRHWPESVVKFLRGPGRTKMMFGTNFPTVGHRHALGQLGELELDPAVERALLGGTARTVFTRLGAELTTQEGDAAQPCSDERDGGAELTKQEGDAAQPCSDERDGGAELTKQEGDTP